MRTVVAVCALAVLAVAFVFLASAGCGGEVPGAGAGVEARVVVDMDPGSDCPGVAPAPVKSHLRVMPLGDSVTTGTSVSNWRETLLAALNAHPDVQTVEFVGTQASPLPCCHEGHPGITTQTATGYMGVWHDRVPVVDVVLVLLGTNDQNPDVVGQWYMPGIIDAALAWGPDVVVVAAPVPYWAPGDDRRKAFNAALVAALHAHAEFGRRLLVADAMADALAPGPDYDRVPEGNDGVHPGPIGNPKVAEVWRAAGAGKLWPAVTP